MAQKKTGQLPADKDKGKDGSEKKCRKPRERKAKKKGNFVGVAAHN